MSTAVASNTVEDLRARLPALAQRWRDGDWQPAEFAAIYFLLFQVARHGARFASRARRVAPKPNAQAWLEKLLRDDHPRHTLIDIFTQHHFLHVIPSVNEAFVNWLRGEWRIHLMETIPSPRDVLRMQIDGIRPATVICAYPRLLDTVVTKRDGLHFLVHDLEHAHKFFHDAAGHALQRQLFEALQALLDKDTFADELRDVDFSAKFDYLISDMNTHPAHGIHYLRAIMIEHALKSVNGAPRDRLPHDIKLRIDTILTGLASRCGFANTLVTDFDTILTPT